MKSSHEEKKMFKSLSITIEKSDISFLVMAVFPGCSNLRKIQTQPCDRRSSNDWLCHTTRGCNWPAPSASLHLQGPGLPVTKRLMTSAPSTGCIRAALFGHKDEDAFSHSARHLHNKLTRVESRGHGVDAQAPAAHFHPSLIGHVGRGVVLRVRVPLVNDLRERREGKQY